MVVETVRADARASSLPSLRKLAGPCVWHGVEVARHISRVRTFIVDSLVPKSVRQGPTAAGVDAGSNDVRALSPETFVVPHKIVPKSWLVTWPQNAPPRFVVLHSNATQAEPML